MRLPVVFLRFLLLAGSAFAALTSKAEHATRERLSFNEGWRFALGHATDPQADFGHRTGYFSYLAKTGYGDGPAHPLFEDRWWRKIDLPHDWAVEAGFDPDASYSHGFKAIGPGFPESSVGWYRRHFHIPAADLGKRISIEFDGIYRDAAVFVNGFFLGQEPSGYVSHSYDMSEYLNYGADNVVVVRADASMEEGWFYEGAGIYRDVWLLKTAPLHVPRYGVWVTTEDTPSGAELSIHTEVVNAGRIAIAFTRDQEVRGPQGDVVARSGTGHSVLPPGETTALPDRIVVENPLRWDLDSPHLYTLVTTLRDSSGFVLDRYETSFGIRTIRFDPGAGFFLNGRHVKLKGTNNHQDHAGVGAAIPDALRIWRLRQLKAMGSNAFRVGHHPASPALLEACDRLGMLVIDENRLMGVNDYHLGQLEHMIRRNRNHPSIILWSIGNEEWAIEGNIRGERIATVMQDFVHRLDPSRPVTAAISGGWGGISNVIEVMGVNYIRHGDTDQQHARFPHQVIVGTEETTTQQTRGTYITDRAQAHLAPLEDGSSGGNVESGWQHYAARDYTAGVFFWTGFDYRGEPTPFDWPAVASQFGILDTCGFPKDSFHYLRAWWTNDPVVHIFPHWNWTGREGEIIEVRVHSNAAAVELFLNDTSLGRQSVTPLHHLAWQVPYAPGRLEARASWPDGVSRSAFARTSGPPARAQLSADRHTISSDARDLAVITVTIQDAQGRFVPTADPLIHFSVTGPGRIIGVGNGNPSSHEPDQFVDRVRSIILGQWQAPPAADAESPVVFECRFDRPALDAGETLTLYLGAIGRGQSATLNGKTLYTHATRDEARAQFPLDPSELQATENALRLVALPFQDWGEREDIARNPPALLGVHTPAGQWQRQTFNGLAQVLLQSTGTPGPITLTATSRDLPPTSLTIQVSAQPD